MFRQNFHIFPYIIGLANKRKYKGGNGMAQIETTSCEKGKRSELRFRGVKLNITVYDLLIRLTGLFMAMAMPYSNITPFGLAFLA